MASTSLNAPYITLVGVVVIGIGMVFTVYQPLFAEISQGRQDVSTNIQTLQQKTAFLADLDVKKAYLQTQAAVESKLQAMLPVEDQAEDMVRIMHVYANESGGTLAAIQNSSTGAQENLKDERLRGDVVSLPSGVNILVFDVKYQGTYEQLRAFISKLQNSPRLVDVTAINISRQNAGSAGLEVQLVINFYSQVPVAAQ